MLCGNFAGDYDFWVALAKLKKACMTGVLARGKPCAEKS